MADNNADSGSDNTAELEKTINRMVDKAVSGALRRINLEQKINTTLESAVSNLLKPADGGEAVEEVQPKTLRGEIEALKAQVQAEAKARKEAEMRAADISLRNEVLNKFQATVGADNPHLSAYLAKLYDVEKRFTKDATGKTVVKVQTEYGDELLPLDDGLNHLMNNELKALMPSKIANMPNTNPYRLAQGQTVRIAPQQQSQGPSELDMVRAELTQKIINSTK